MSSSGSAPSVLILVENLSVPEDRRVWAECRVLRRAGWDITVVCPEGPVRDRGPHDVVDGVDIHRYRPAKATGGVTGYLREYAVALWHTRRLVRRLARSRRFDVVHACNPPDLLLLAALPLRRKGARFIFDHHDLVPELYLTRFGGGPLHRCALLAERLSFRLADVVLATNESFRRIALGRGRKRPDQVFVVRNGPDLDQFVPRAPDPDLRKGKEHLIAYVGIMSEQDGVDHAIRALAELARGRDDWHAVFAGEGDCLEATMQLAAELGLGSRVEFPGFITDKAAVARLIASASVCLAPEPRNVLNDRSTMIKVAEYMAMARPVVAYDLAESRFSARDAAVYGSDNDPATLAAAIDDLLDDPDRREAMGREGRQRVESELAWQHSAKVLVAAYDHALALARPARRREARSDTVPRPIADASRPA